MAKISTVTSVLYIYHLMATIINPNHGLRRKDKCNRYSHQRATGNGGGITMDEKLEIISISVDGKVFPYLDVEEHTMIVCEG